MADRPAETATSATAAAPAVPQDDRKRLSSSPASRPAAKRSKSSQDAADSSVQSTFEAFRDEIDAHNDRRERLIKTSRDVTSLSKKLIFHLHRYDIRSRSQSSTQPDDSGRLPALSKNDRLFKEAEAKLQEIISILRTIAVQEGLNEADGVDRWARYEHNLGGGLEEFIESLSFFHFLQHGTLITLPQVQSYFVDDTTSQPMLRVPVDRYLLGLSDLTGELMRLATNAVGQGDTGSYVAQILALLRAIRDALDPFVPFIRDMKKKQQVTKQSVGKIEDVMYAITVRSSEFQQDPQALREMLRRSLASASNDSSKPEDDDA
ncbi:hypothetical protein ACQY0O_005208 [Thecaphora frezii]